MAERFGIPREDLLSKLQPEPMVVLRVLGGIIGIASSAVFWVFLLPFFFFSFSWKFPRLVSGFTRLIPASRKPALTRIAVQIDREWGNFFRARLLVGILAGFLMAFGWFLTAVPYWFLLGMIGGLLGIVPYLSIVAWIAVLLFKYLSAGGAPALPDIFWPSLVFWSVHLFEEWVLIPWIQSYSLNLSAVTIIIVILIGGAVGGIGGLLFAIPVASAVKIIFQELYVPAAGQGAGERT
jgi:predicted PurR-regulated permease PerM